MYTCPVGCSAENLLAAGGGPVSKGSTKGLPTSTVTIRMPKVQIARIELEAASSGLSRSAYIEARLRYDDLVPCPSLAALARLIAVHEVVVDAKAVDAQQLEELKLLVLQLAQAAHREAEAL